MMSLQLISLEERIEARCRAQEKNGRTMTLLCSLLILSLLNSVKRRLPLSYYLLGYKSLGHLGQMSLTDKTNNHLVTTYQVTPIIGQWAH